MPLTAPQLRHLEQFKQCTGCKNTKTATEYLKNYKWNIERAVQEWYAMYGDETGSEGEEIDMEEQKLEREAEEVFGSLQDEPDLIGPAGTEKLCQELQVEPEDVVMLALSWKLESERMCEFKKEPWISNWSSMKCGSISDMRAAIPRFRKMLQSPDTFKAIYIWTYNFAREEGQKSVNTPTALSLWRLLLPDRFIYLDQWIAFVESKNVKSIPRDTWVLLHDFAMTIAKDLSKYSDDDAWPVLIDEFVATLRADT